MLEGHDIVFSDGLVLDFLIKCFFSGTELLNVVDKLSFIFFEVDLFIEVVVDAFDKQKVKFVNVPAADHVVCYLGDFLHI